MAKFLEFLKNNKYFSAFIICFMAFFVHLISSGKTIFYYDAEQYWRFGSSFVKDGNFSIFNYTEGLRGVWFPMILFSLQYINHYLQLDPILIVRIFSALYISSFIAFLVPKLISRIYPEIKISFFNILFFGVLVFIFWRNYFNYPLSDFPAIILLIWGVFFLFSRKLIVLFFSGILFGMAINIRPIFLISLLPVIVFLFLDTDKQTFVKSLFKPLLKFGYILIGILIISIPQILVNKNAFNTISPLVQTKNSIYGKDLYLQQLILSFSYEKYETNIGLVYPKPPVFFCDRLGSSIAQKEQANTLKNYGGFLKIYAKYPVEMSCIYFKHIFNGLDIKDNTVYLSEVNRRNYFFSLLNYSVLFFFLLSLFIYRKYLFNSKRKIFFPIILIISAVLAIPTAIETRFMLPIFLFAYIVVSFLVEYKVVYNSLSRLKKSCILILYMAFLIISFVLSNTTYSNVEIIQHTVGKIE